MQVNTGSRPDSEFQSDFPKVLKSMQSDVHFPMDKVFSADHPKESLPQGRPTDLVKQCLDRFGVSWMHLCQYSFVSRFTYSIIYI